MTVFEDLLYPLRDRRQDHRDVTPIIEGRVHAVGAAGVTFTVPSWDDGKHKFGPAPYVRSLVETTSSGGDPAHDHEGTTPTVGARCLVVFAPSDSGDELGNPWVIGWWPA